MKKQIFTGSGVAIVTPFNTDGTINYEQLAKLIDFQIENGTDCIISCGTTGETSTLSEKEHIDVLDFTIKKVAKRIPVVAGTGSNDTSFSIELSKEAEKLGADGLLLITPYYNKTSQKGLIESFTKIANSTDTPVILYNVPSRTSVNITPETYFELSKHPKIVATKEANGDIHSAVKTLSLCGDNLAMYTGEDSLTMPIMAIGGIGVISVFANACPKELKTLVTAMQKNDYKLARDLTNKYLSLMDAFFMDVNPIPIKEALSQMGFCNNTCRLPLTTMTDGDIAKMSKMLKEYSLI